MAAKTWTVIDRGTGTHVDELILRPNFEGRGGAACCVQKRTLLAGLSANVDVIRIDNGRLSFDVLPTRGMGIWKAWLGGAEIGWQSPVRGPVHPQFVSWSEPSGLGWLDGFDELLVRCGLESNGAPEFDDQGRVRFPLHGRIANRPAQRVDIEIDDQTGEIRAVGEVDEARFLFHQLRLRSTIATRAGTSEIRIRDEITNLSQRPGTFQLLYHVNFGLPLLDAGSRFRAPATAVVPRDPRAAEGIATWDRYAAPEAGYAEQVYFLRLCSDAAGQTQALLRNAGGTQGVSLHFDVRQLPCFTLWKNTAATADGYVTGMEPATNFPNPRSFEQSQGRVIALPPQDTYTIDLRMVVHGDAAEVAAAEGDIRKLQGETKPTVHPQPLPGWCPVG